MSQYAEIPSTAITIAITSTSAALPSLPDDADRNARYMITPTVNAWVCQSQTATPAVVAGAGCVYVAAGRALLITILGGPHIAVIADSTSGHATLATAMTL